MAFLWGWSCRARRSLRVTAARTAARCRRASAPRRWAGRDCTGRSGASPPSRAGARSSPRPSAGGRRAPSRGRPWSSTRPPAAPEQAAHALAPTASRARSRTRPLTSVSPRAPAPRAPARRPARTPPAPAPASRAPGAPRPARPTSSPSSSTTSGISSACRATPPSASAALRRSYTRRSWAAC